MGGIQRVDGFRIDGVGRQSPPLSVEFDTSLGVIGEENLRLDSLQATEAVSQPFEVHLEMRGDDFSPARQYPIRAFLGRPATVSLALPDAETGLPSRNLRYFNGIVSQFTLAENGIYRAALKPALWRASLTNHYRVFQKMTIAETIARVLDSHQVTHELHLGSIATSRVQDWLQAGETDLDFVHRLMEKANVYYYFVHEKNRHVMVLANRPCYRTLLRHVGRSQEPLTLRYVHTAASELGSQKDDVLTQYQYQESLTSSGVDFLLARSKAAWEPDEIDRANYSSASHSSGNVAELPFRQYKVFQYGGGIQEASELGTESWDKLNTAASGLSGGSTSPLLCPGHVFSTADATLPGSPEYGFDAAAYESESLTVRSNLANRSFVVTQVQHKASNTEPYSNNFEATDADGFITPFNMQSTQQGTILAVVEPTGGAVEPSDWRYLEKSNFAFETYGFQDRETPEKLNGLGVYVRFITDDMTQVDKKPVWVKLSQTMQTVPEAGVVVMVSRSNDDSEVPEIQGIVQAFGSKVILPQRWSANTSVGSNYSTSYGDSKSVRYGLHSKADLKSAVAIVESAYDSGRYKDCSYSQGAGYNYSTSESGRSGLLSCSTSFGNTESEYTADYTRSKSDIGYTWSESLIGSSDSYNTVTGKSYSKSKIGEQESDTTVLGNSKHKAMTVGNSSGSSVTVGNSDNFSATFGNALSAGVTIGAHASLNTHIGLKSDNSLFVGGQANSFIFLGRKSDLSVFIGGQSSIDLTLAAKNSVSLSLSTNSSIAMNISDNSSLAMNVSANNSMSMNLSANNSLSLNLGLNNSIEMAASINNTIGINAALNNSIKLNAALNNEVNLNAVIDNKTDINLLEVKTKTTPLEVITESANVKCRIGNMDVEIMTMKIFI